MMKKVVLGLVFLLQIPLPSFAQTAENSLQLIVVTSSGWNISTGTLKKYERKSKTASWDAVGAQFDVVVGKNGMAWGKDFLKLAGEGEPIKKEGDGKSPAGLFFVGPTFGFEPSPRENYRQLKNSTYCVDDTDSEFYNQIIDTEDPKITSNPPHNEKMRDQEFYKIGAEIKYGSSRKLGSGSCIFLHIWKDSGHGTAGCVAMEEKHIKSLIEWLNPKFKPVIALLPRPTYDKVQKSLRLPSLENTTDFSHLIKFEIGKTKFASGDNPLLP